MSIRGRLRQRYGRFKKRRLFVSLAVVLVIVMLSLLVLAALGIFGSRSELCTIRVQNEARPIQSLQGTGINLDTIPLTNFIKDGSFESHNSFNSFHIAGVTGDKVLMDISDGEIGSLDLQKLAGSNLRIYTIDENGNTALGVKAGILSYSPANFSSMEEVDDANWYWTSDPFVELVSCNNVTTGITRQGFLISDIESLELSRKREADDPFIDICASSRNMFAVTSSGEVLFSNDGKNFSEMISFDTNDSYSNAIKSGEVEITKIASVNDDALMLLSDGRLLLCTYNGITEIDRFSSDIADIENTEDSVFVFLTDGSVYRSTNGIVYSEVSELKEILSGRKIERTASSPDGVGVLLEGGSILMINSEEYKVTEAPSDTKDICIFENGELIVLSSSGEAKVLYDGSFINLDVDIDSIFSTGEYLLLMRGNTVYKTSICSSIQVDRVIAEDTVFAGDICFVDTFVPACSFTITSESESDGMWELSDVDGMWDAYGDGTVVSAVEGAPSGLGSKCARIMGINDGIHVLSQKIADSGEEVFTKNDFLRIDAWLMQSGLEDPTVKIWLSSEGCKDVGFVVDDCKTSFKDYHNVFVASDEMIKSKNEIRLNISFEGKGELRIDGVYLGLDKYSSSEIPASFEEKIIGSSPNAIRLNNLRFGSDGVSYDAFFSTAANSNSFVYDSEEGPVNNCASLEDSLKLVKDSKAFPWLVIGSSANSDSIDAMLEYMCGSVSSYYGNLRINNGTAVPWSRQFKNVLVEINDADGIFVNDIQRSSYVNYIIGIIKQSDHYVDFKDNIVFIDGMNYDGGNMLSNADCHCSTYESDGTYTDNVTFIDYINEEYIGINTNTPRINSYGTDTGEFISSFDISEGVERNDMTAGKCLVSILSDESSFARMIMVDLHVKRGATDLDNIINEYDSVMLNSLNMINGLKFSERLAIDVQKPLSGSAEGTLDEFNSNVGTYIFKTDKGLVLIVANASDTQQQFLIDGLDLSLKGSLMTRYSADGEELQTEKMSGRHPRYTLQAGQVLIVQVVNE